MRFLEVRHEGDLPFLLTLHPRVTVVSGLGAHRRGWLADALAGALRGEGADAEIVAELKGEPHVLSPSMVDELGIAGLADVVVRADDLPRSRARPGAAEVRANAADPGLGTGRRAGGDGGSPPDDSEIEMLAAELDRTTAMLVEAERQCARDQEVMAETLADLEAASDDDAAQAETALQLEQARRHRSDAAARLEDLERAAAQAIERDRALGEAHEVLVERRHALDTSANELRGALTDVVVPDATPVRRALEAARAERAPVPVPEALELAAAIDAAARRVEEPAETLPEQEGPRAELGASAVVALGQLDVRYVAALEQAHDAVDQAEQRLAKRISRLGAKRALADARWAEQRILRRLGLNSYGEYLLCVANPNVVLDRQRLARPTTLGRRESREATVPRSDGRELAELRERASRLLDRPTEGDVAQALRDLRQPDPAAGQVVDELAAVLRLVGAAAAGDPLVEAEVWLASVEEAHRQRATWEVQLGAVEVELRSLAVQLDTLPSPSAPMVQERLEEARRSLDDADAAEETAELASAEADERLAIRGAARDRLAAQTDALQRRHALVADARANVTELEEHVRAARLRMADAVREWEQRQARKLEPPMEVLSIDRITPATSATVDRMAVEVYLLARVAAQRDVGQVGALPLVVDEALAGVPGSIKSAVLDLLARVSPTLQIVYLSDDPDVESWATSLGSEVAHVRRFSSTLAA